MTTFFKSLGDMGVAQFSISVSFYGSDCAVSLLPKVVEGDNALNTIRPFTLKGSIDEIDAVFFERLGRPMEETKVLFNNASQYLDNLKKVEEKTKMASDQKEKKKKALSDLKEVVKGKTFNPLTEHEKAVELANKVLELDESDPLAKKTIEDMKAYQQPTFF
ncbi:hypothetical protein [Maribacter sp. ACAM166]|uniref:hypothetical protein n=1 Tax=Maribacter sp. ACAM166 TaxID=2508996 RepID=UPI0010FDFBF5|nr:hypothetical protein [Maribacter sp. ACAM166]TLP81842.1 hypothetical protein ES765_03950 [Maribacter sp. ACAM166]